MVRFQGKEYSMLLVKQRKTLQRQPRIIKKEYLEFIKINLEIIKKEYLELSNFQSCNSVLNL